MTPPITVTFDADGNDTDELVQWAAVYVWDEEDEDWIKAFYGKYEDAMVIYRELRGLPPAETFNSVTVQDYTPPVEAPAPTDFLGGFGSG